MRSDIGKLYLAYYFAYCIHTLTSAHKVKREELSVANTIPGQRESSVIMLGF